ncbi:MAG TPA: efflux RND transporter periplasmic adaptor subunit [Phycisphaeraceae bacterium]
MSESSPLPKRPVLKKVSMIVTVALAVLLLAGTAAGMFLLLRSEDEPGEARSDTLAASQSWYTCGMHPWVVSPEPGLCPICHMELTPVDPERFSAQIAIDPVVVQNIGVRIAEATAEPLVKELRTVGVVQPDPRRVRDVVVRADGYIEELLANYEGMPVKQGQVLARMHSPQVLAAAQELLVAAQFADDAAAQNRLMLQAAREALAIKGVSEDQIDAILRNGQAPRTYEVRSPIDGVVRMMGGYEGGWLKEGDRLTQVVDLSRVWVIVTVYESDLPMVKLGQRADVTLSHLPGRTFEGRVTYIDPFLNEQARQARVRLELENPDGLLKPGMFAQVRLESTAAPEATLVPREAVIDTGERQLVFVSRGRGRFEPREVVTGMTTADGRIQILQGVEPGQRVVTSGQFLLDSESRIREAMAKMMGGEPSQPAREAPAHQHGTGPQPEDRPHLAGVPHEGGALHLGATP